MTERGYWNRGFEKPVIVYPYPCGFDPRGKKLAAVTAHWRACVHSRCQQMAADFEPLKRELTKGRRCAK